MLSKISSTHIRFTLMLVWLLIFFNIAQPMLLLTEYGGFALLGVLGAIFANSTGAGGGVVFHIVETLAIYWPVVMFAGAGAIIGGILAKHLVLYFSAKNLKIFWRAGF